MTPDVEKPHPSVRQKLEHEITRFAVMFIYLWLLFGLFALYQSILQRQEGNIYHLQGFAIINALVLAKVMLIAEDLKLGGPMAKRPIIYGVVRASASFALVFIAFHVAEQVVVGLFHGSSLYKSVPAIGGGGTWGLLTVAAILFIALLPYFAFRDINNRLGRGALRKLLFSPPTNSGA